MINDQQKFLKDEVWLLIYAGAFQHNLIYVENITDKQREDFREGLRSYIESVIHPTYQKPVDDKHHGNNILAIIEFTRSFSQLLNNGELNVGTVQKVLNLSLKYYWCLGLLNEPPHFPIDRTIQKLLPANVRINWTQIDSINQYQIIVNAISQIIPKNLSLATWELEHYNKNR